MTVVLVSAMTSIAIGSLSFFIVDATSRNQSQISKLQKNNITLAQDDQQLRGVIDALDKQITALGQRPSAQAGPPPTATTPSAATASTLSTVLLRPTTTVGVVAPTTYRTYSPTPTTSQAVTTTTTTPHITTTSRPTSTTTITTTTSTTRPAIACVVGVCLGGTP